MGDFFKTVGTVASVLIPGAAPVVAAASGLISALSPHPAAAQPVADPLPPLAPGMTFGDVAPNDPGSAWSGTLASDTLPIEASHVYQPPTMGFYGAPPFISSSDGGITVTPGSIAGGALSFIPPFTIGGGAAAALGGGAMLGTAVAVGRALLPAVERVVPKILLGTSVGTAIYELYRRLRGAGHGHKRARRLALAANGVVLRRRRMRVTNIHALNRAIRRVRGFRRKARKVHGLFGAGRHSAAPHYRRRRVYRRGDLDPFLVEDTADMMDEWEDAGFEPETFPMASQDGVE